MLKVKILYDYPCSITSGGQAATISCSAQSVLGTQFQSGSSAGLTG